MAHKKSGGSTRNGRDSQGQRLGVKHFGGELVNSGAILVRQRGSHFHAGINVGTGSDYTLFAKAAGQVKFTGNSKLRRRVHVVPCATQA